MRLINRHPKVALATFLAALPFVAVGVAYMIGSDIRLAANPADKLLPAFSTIGETAERLFTQPDKRSGKILLWHDTAASLRRRLPGSMRPSSPPS